MCQKKVNCEDTRNSSKRVDLGQKNGKRPVQPAFYHGLKAKPPSKAQLWEQGSETLMSGLQSAPNDPASATWPTGSVP